MILKSLKYNFSKIIAITEKNIKLGLRFKYALIIGFVTPIIGIILPLVIMGVFFETRESIGPWNAQNIFLYQFIAYQILLLRRNIDSFPSQFRMEKFWKTLPALIIAPFNRFNLLLGIILSEFILISIPFSVFFILGYIIHPLSIITIFFVIMLYFLVTLVFSGIGLILGIFAISKENILAFLKFALSMFFFFSCISYPFEIFPSFIQNIINLNPLYYIFDILRRAWIDNNFISTILIHYAGLMILIISAIILPLVGVYTFNLIYKKYGIVGA